MQRRAFINLFNLVMDGLSRMLHSAIVKGDIHGIRIARYAPEVSHLHFADDLLIFCRGNLTQVDSVLDILRIF